MYFFKSFRFSILLLVCGKALRSCPVAGFEPQEIEEEMTPVSRPVLFFQSNLRLHSDSKEINSFQLCIKLSDAWDSNKLNTES